MNHADGWMNGWASVGIWIWVIIGLAVVVMVGVAVYKLWSKKQ